MKTIFAAPLSLALLAASPPTPVVQVATGDWSNLPPLEVVGYDHLSTAIMSKVYAIGRQNKCKLPGQYGSHIDMSITFAAQFTKEGELTRLVLPQLNCPEAEAWLGGTLLKSIQHRDFRPDMKHPNSEGWYRGDFSFYYEG
jgi:hypothetical protein